jgi:hypothetical protein
VNVPQKYEQNPKLGVWVNKQRMEHKSRDDGNRTSLTEQKLQALDAIGFVWAKRKGQPSWDARFHELIEYFAREGHSNVPTKFTDNPALGRWVSTQRSQYKMFKNNEESQMTQDRIERLESLSFKWRMTESGEHSE